MKLRSRLHRHLRGLALVALMTSVTAACAGAAPREPSATSTRTVSSPTGPAEPSTSSAATKAPQSTAGRPASQRHASKVLVVIEENHSLAQMRNGMPYLAALSRTYGYATHWEALRHPSEPNYLAITGGSTFGVSDDRAPSSNAGKVGAAHSVLEQALARHKSAATYAESMPAPCYLTNADGPTTEPGPYAVRHNPWTYYPTERADCRRHDVSTQTFKDDARNNRLPNIGFLIPNLLHDAHDASLGEADSWLREQLPSVLSSRDFEAGRLVLVVTADEDDKHSGNIVLTSVLAARLHHKVVSAPLTHYSLTRYLDTVIGAPPLKNARTAADLQKAFGL